MLAAISTKNHCQQLPIPSVQWSTLITVLWSLEYYGRLRLPDSVISALGGGNLSALRTDVFTPSSILVPISRGWVDPGHFRMP
jgi:hypothetical protein